jgi:hypothetical protein
MKKRLLESYRASSLVFKDRVPEKLKLNYKYPSPRAELG